MPDTIPSTRGKTANKQAPALKALQFEWRQTYETKKQKFVICQVAVNAMKKNRAEDGPESDAGRQHGGLSEQGSLGRPSW